MIFGTKEECALLIQAFRNKPQIKRKLQLRNDSIFGEILSLNKEEILEYWVEKIIKTNFPKNKHGNFQC